MQALPVFTFANQAGLDMLETTLVALQDITLEKIFDDNGRKILCSEFPQIMQQVECFEIHWKNIEKSVLFYLPNKSPKARIISTKIKNKWQCMKK
jgi:hypothetical protein